MAQRKQTVWVVMHYEIMGLPDAPLVDSVQFHVASSLGRAEAYIRSVRVEAHSWWQVHPLVVDSADESEEVNFYSRRGTPLRRAPTSRAIAAFRRYARDHPEYFPKRRDEQK